MRNLCPECDQPFKKGWTGIDAHWRSNQGHEHIMPYEKAWPLIQLDLYGRGGKRLTKRKPREDFAQAAFRAMQETIRRSES